MRFDVTGPNPNDKLEVVVWMCVLGCPILLIFGGIGALVGWLVSCHQLLWMLIGAAVGIAVPIFGTLIGDWL